MNEPTNYQQSYQAYLQDWWANVVNGSCPGEPLSFEQFVTRAGSQEKARLLGQLYSPLS